VITGHTHLPAVRKTADGLVTINTGSFCPPLGAYAVDVGEDELRVRKIETRNGEYRTGGVVAEFPLARD
jgi:predicted phosphodiesterase